MMLPAMTLCDPVSEYVYGAQGNRVVQRDEVSYTLSMRDVAFQFPRKLRHSKNGEVHYRCHQDI